MTGRKLFGGALLMSLVAFSLGAEPVYAQSSKPVLEPKAIELLKVASNRLAAAHAMSFTAVVTEESPSRLAIPLAYTTKSDAVMQRPDKLRVITLGDGPASEFYYDGKIMMAYSPAEDFEQSRVRSPRRARAAGFEPAGFERASFRPASFESGSARPGPRHG
jgi:hypothetical protein